MALVNIPKGLDEMGSYQLPCETYVYGAYLPSGIHEFVIYCPETQRAFCQEVPIDLSKLDYFTESPQHHRKTF